MFCDWDTTPELSHQEDVPVSITSPLNSGGYQGPWNLAHPARQPGRRARLTAETAAADASSRPAGIGKDLGKGGQEPW